MPLDTITISGTYRGKPAAVWFARNDGDNAATHPWLAAVRIDGEHYEYFVRAGNRPSMELATRLVKQALGIKPRRRTDGRPRLKLHGED